MHAPSSPAQEPQRERLEDAQQPAAEAPVSPEQQSELDALDLDLREAERHLERQLQAKQDEARFAERRALEKDEGKRDGKKKEPAPPPQKERPGGGVAQTKPGAKPGLSAGMDLDEDQDTTVAVRGAPCDLGCRALKSMQLSASRICELAGKESTRCQLATQRVARAAERVRAAGCQCSVGNGELMSRVGGERQATAAAARCDQRPPG